MRYTASEPDNRIRSTRRWQPRRSARATAYADVGDLGETRAPAHRWQRGAEAELDTLGAPPKAGRDLRPRVQRMSTGLRQLERSGKLDGADIASAVRWRQTYELVVHGAKDPAAGGNSGSGGVPMWLAAIVDLATEHREATQAVGPQGAALLLAFVAEGMSLRAIAEGRGHAASGSSCLRVRLSEQLVEAIKGLTEHYAAAQARARAARGVTRRAA